MRSLVLLFGLLGFGHLYAQQWNWAASAGGGGNTDLCNGIATDGQGNVYWAGSVSGTAEFGCGTLTPGNTIAGFIAKRGPDGTCQWARGITVNSNDAWVYGIAIDAEDRIYVTGSYDGNATFGNGIVLNSLGSDDIFVARYSTDGDCLWARRAGSSGSSDEARGIAVSDDGGVFITGISGGNTITFDAVQIANAGNSRQVVIARYDSTGTVQWAKASTGSGQGKSSRGISVAGDRLYITGQVGFSLSTFDGEPLTPDATSTNLFVLACDLDGNAQWARSYGNGDHQGMGISADTLGNVFVAGRMWGTFRTPVNTLSSVSSNDDILLLALDASGEHRWARSAGSAQRDLAWGVTADGQGNVYAAMQFNNSIDLLGTPVTALGGEDALIAKVDNDGELVWLSRPSGFQRDIPLCIHRENDAPHRLHFGGYYWGTITYGNSTIDDVQNGDAMVVSGIDTTFHVSTYAPRICSGSCDGVANAFANGTGPFTFLWSNGATTASISGLCAGEYIVEVTDAAGSISADTVLVVEHDPIELNVQQDGDSLWVEGSGGQWSWQLDGFTVSAGVPYHIAWSSGSYMVQFLDEHGCLSGSNTIIVLLNVGVEEVEQEALRIYPNPASSIVFISGSYEPLVSAYAVDVLGRSVEVPVIGQGTLDVRNLAQGAWIIMLESGTGTRSIRLVKE